MNIILILPIVIPLVVGTILILFRRPGKIQIMIANTGMVLHLFSSLILFRSVMDTGIHVSQMGNWPAPFGITLVADMFSAIMLVLAAIVSLAVLVFSTVNIDDSRKTHGFYPLLFFLLMGVSGSFLTGDIFNLYVWFEVMLISSFVLLVLGGERPQLEGAIKYVTLNLLGSTLFLVGIGILYGKMGTLNMADLAFKLRNEAQSGLISSSAILIFIAFGIKAAAFPFFFWLPASYHTPPAAVSAIFSGLLTKVGVYAMIRVFTLIFVHDPVFTHTIILITAALTMFFGVLGAAAQYDIRRILSFHIVSQIGYMLMGLGLFSPLALAGAVLYIIHHIVVKSTLFLVAGIISLYTGSYRLKEIGGIYKNSPLLSFLFLIPALSLAGIPPLSGFWAKYTLIKAGIDGQNSWIVGTALLVSLITLYSMTKIWSEGFWKPAPDSQSVFTSKSRRLTTILPVLFLIAMTVIIGLAAEPFFQISLKTAEQLMNPSQYIQAVLGKG